MSNTCQSNVNSPNKGATVSTSTSSFEALDPHDPKLSRLALTMMENIQDYVISEITAAQDQYKLLEDMNKFALDKYSDMNKMVNTVNQNIEETNSIAEDPKVLLHEIEVIEQQVNKLEESSARITSYVKSLLSRCEKLESRARQLAEAV